MTNQIFHLNLIHFIKKIQYVYQFTKYKVENSLTAPLSNVDI